MINKSVFFLLFACLLATLNVDVYAAQAGDSQLKPVEYKPLVSEKTVQQQIKVFAKKMASDHRFDESAILNQLTNMQHNAGIIKKITKPAESMPWYRYQKIWMQDKRIDAGVEFWQKHAKTLARAEKEYGVAQEIIVGIIGVETFFGRIQGSYPVIEALHTLGFYYPARADFFRSELVEYYLLAREQNWKLETVKGSYAGAMGMGQFISSSYRAYGVDFNHDNKVNLFTDTVDMIGSVANYFSKHHWSQGGFVASPVELKQTQKKVVQHGLKLKYTVSDLKNEGVDTSDLQNKTRRAGVFAFDRSKSEQEHWLVGDNFYVITRYNRSPMYALAVHQLSQAIASKRKIHLASLSTK